MLVLREIKGAWTETSSETSSNCYFYYCTRLCWRPPPPTHTYSMFGCRQTEAVPGHKVLQVLFCTDMPSQKAPPLRGVGLVQVRERFCTPRPQRTLQGDQSVHDDQPPFTGVKGQKENGAFCSLRRRVTAQSFKFIQEHFIME